MTQEGMEMKRVLIGGGARSGKSACALARARAFGARRVFLATAQETDDDMRQRIARHRVDRGNDFTTIEEPIELPATLARLTDVDVVLIDCLTLWVSNLLARGAQEPEIVARVDTLIDATSKVPFHVIFVTNEVGMGVHPESAIGRLFRDVAGRMHQRLAHHADEVYFAALGMVLRLRPEPVVASACLEHV
jgi:adenosylcobinamide kinase/adenosylcobinamide-phosphate guanylyltransferase